MSYNMRRSFGGARERRVRRRHVLLGVRANGDMAANAR